MVYLYILLLCIILIYLNFCCFYLNQVSIIHQISLMGTPKTEKNVNNWFKLIINRHENEYNFHLRKLIFTMRKLIFGERKLIFSKRNLIFNKGKSVGGN